MVTVLLFFLVFIGAIAGVIVGSKFVFQRYVKTVSVQPASLESAKKDPNKDLKKYAQVYFLTGMMFTLIMLICAFNYKTEHTVEVIEIGQDAGKKEIKPVPVTEYIPPDPNVNIESLDIIEVPEKEIVKEIKEEIDPQEFIPQETGDVMDMFANPGVGSESFTGPKVESKTELKFKCGDFDAFMEKHKVYPELAREEGISGSVTVRVFIDDKGKMIKERTKVVGPVHPDLDKEAIRLMHLTDEQCGWEPAKMRGNRVGTYGNFTIKFNLGD